jgi:hypothetical protein
LSNEYQVTGPAGDSCAPCDGAAAASMSTPAPVELVRGTRGD